jgi:hypothetical protein
VPMANANSGPANLLLDRLATALSGLPWSDVLGELWTALRKALSGSAEEGMYEVLEYESTLELLDDRGLRARFQKHEKVLYLQSNIIAYQDQAWGDGQILIRYRCAPGTPVDQYRPGQKTYILISLREVRNRGDVDEFKIEWEMKRSFMRSTELWETEVNHRTQKLKSQVIFPRDRPPHRTVLIESTIGKIHLLGQEAIVRLPNGRWSVSWETSQPRLYERYQLKWEW